jgi:hypothetical protein
VEVLKYPWVARLADDLSDPMVIAATASEELRHGSVSGTLGFAELARAVGENDFIFDYRGVAVANIDLANVYGRSCAEFVRDLGDPARRVAGPGSFAKSAHRKS